jgi:hypothetical protein
MSNESTASIQGFPVARDAVAAQPARQAYHVLHFVFAFVPIIAGIDKFLHLLVNWDTYLAPRIANLSATSAWL